MNCSHNHHRLISQSNKLSSQGFSLVEAIVSLLVLFAIMSGIVPIFISSRLRTINNDIRTGAISVSQEILDELRQDTNVKDWPIAGTQTQLPSGTNIASPVSRGRTYNAAITYCEDGASLCSADSSRQVTLTIDHNGNNIYTIQTVYTQFQ